MRSPIGAARQIRLPDLSKMKRGEIWTVAGGKDYAGKPRPAVILQDDRFNKTDSITICAFTTDPTDAPLFRILVEPTESNGLRSPCRLMVDKITTVPKARAGTRVGRLAGEDMVRLNRAVLVFFGIAAPRD
jgi:mRNA interferase MazF